MRGSASSFVPAIFILARTEGVMPYSCSYLSVSSLYSLNRENAGFFCIPFPVIPWTLIMIPFFISFCAFTTTS